jgi:hypothetical protein
VALRAWPEMGLIRPSMRHDAIQGNENLTHRHRVRQNTAAGIGHSGGSRTESVCCPSDSTLQSEVVRRLSATLLLAAISFPLVALVALASADRDSSIPACCRKDGKHKCAMSEMSDEISGSSFRVTSRCPMFPTSGAAPVCSSSTGALVPSSDQVGEIAAPVNRSEQAELLYRISFNRSRQKRGPPSLFDLSI